MAENFENLDNVLHHWPKDKVQESLVQALNWYQKKDKAVSLVENDSEKILEQSQSAVEQD